MTTGLVLLGLSCLRTPWRQHGRQNKSGSDTDSRRGLRNVGFSRSSERRKEENVPSLMLQRRQDREHYKQPAEGSSFVTWSRQIRSEPGPGYGFFERRCQLLIWSGLPARPKRAGAGQRGRAAAIRQTDHGDLNTAARQRRRAGRAEAQGERTTFFEL